MKTKQIALAFIAGLTMPVAAQAHAKPGHVTRTELRHDVRQVREEKRDLKEELRERDWRGAKEERRELGKAKHELKQDTRRFHRQHNRGR
ncbi:MAG: hypothetical protein J0L50_00820 [Sphingomonadales bacterium]|nr:hypothetical protein [Sphingomonadales bacterium]